MGEVTFERYGRWVTFWSAALGVSALVVLSPVLLPARAGVIYGLAIGFAASIVTFRVACADAEHLGDLSSPAAARGAVARVFLRFGVMLAALAGAGAAGGWQPAAILAAAGGLFLTRIVVMVEAVFGLVGG